MSPRQPARRSLQARLALLYAAGIYAAGIIVLLVAELPFARIGSTRPAGHTSATTSATSGQGVGPHQLLVASAIALVVLIPVALAFGWFVAGRFLRPLRSIGTKARAISAGSLHQRLDLGAPTDELTVLGHTLDDLFARLEVSFEAQRHFVANASHELRTPLAGLRTLLEVTLANPNTDAATYRSACEDALALGQHQERLVDALLTLARSERGVTAWETVDLADICRTVLASRCDRAVAGGVQIAEQLSPAVTTGDPRLIESLVVNLIGNAIRHNHPDGFVEITTQAAGRYATVTVINSGLVIPGDQLERLLQPFQRLSPDRSHQYDGHGLGLAIVNAVNAVSDAHHATLDIRARPAGGLHVAVDFMASGETPRADGRASTPIGGRS